MSNLSDVRTMIGGTAATSSILSDTDVNTAIARYSYLNSSGGTVSVNLPAAAADCASALAAHYANQFDFSEDGQNFSRAQRVGHYVALERELRNRSGGIAVSLGGTLTT